jgi:hypothetical protein
MIFVEIQLYKYVYERDCGKMGKWWIINDIIKIWLFMNMKLSENFSYGLESRKLIKNNLCILIIFWMKLYKNKRININGIRLEIINC